MTNKVNMSSVELGALWTTYHKKTMIMRILESFIEKSDDQKAKDLMSGLWEQLDGKVIEIKTMLQNEGAAIPNAFRRKMLIWVHPGCSTMDLISCSVEY
jgi:hypothetical protein